MTEEPEQKRSKWPLIIIITSIFVLIVVFVIGVQFSSTSETGGDAARPTSVDSQEVLISIFDYKYSPAIVSIPRGAEVTWVNDDKLQHTATQRESAWDTQVLSEGESSAIKFSRPGTYNYFCTIHPYMTGTITVR